MSEPARQPAAPLLAVEDLRHVFRTPGGRLYAVNGVSFAIAAGESVGLVGESGAGKSTVARCLVRLLEPSGGRISFAGREITNLGEDGLRPLRAKLQMVFQDPMLSLNPRLTVRQTLREPLTIHGVAGRGDVEHHLTELMEQVNLDPALLGRRPGALSGGQRQRIGIARAIASRPDFVVLDEPTSSLDLSIQAQIIELLRRLQRELGMAYLFISHDLTTIRSLCTRVIVMYLGQIVEEGPTAAIFADPKHPYTQALLSAAPVADPRRRHEKRRIVLPGETPSLHRPIAGCPLADRCPYVEPSHRVGAIPLVEVGDGGHRVACLLYQGESGSTGPVAASGMRENGSRS